VNICKLRGKEY